MGSSGGAAAYGEGLEAKLRGTVAKSSGGTAAYGEGLEAKLRGTVKMESKPYWVFGRNYERAHLPFIVPFFCITF